MSFHLVKITLWRENCLSFDTIGHGFILRNKENLTVRIYKFFQFFDSKRHKFTPFPAGHVYWPSICCLKQSRSVLCRERNPNWEPACPGVNCLWCSKNMFLSSILSLNLLSFQSHSISSVPPTLIQELRQNKHSWMTQPLFMLLSHYLFVCFVKVLSKLSLTNTRIYSIT